jgi:hypothetical protein
MSSSPSKSKCPYAVLGTNSQASASEVRAAYVAAALSAHPDKGGSAAAFTDVQWAWELVRDRCAERERNGGDEGSGRGSGSAINFVPCGVPLRDSVPLSEWDEVEGASAAAGSILVFACRCGGSYHLSLEDVTVVRSGVSAVAAACDNCSLSVLAIA